jgi:hypothetical protein
LIAWIGSQIVEHWYREHDEQKKISLLYLITSPFKMSKVERSTMTIARRALVTLALAALVSISAGAFTSGDFVKNAAGDALAGKRQLPIPGK